MRRTASTFTTVRSEEALLPPELLARIVGGTATSVALAPSTTTSDFDTTVENVPTANLRARVADIGHRADRAEQCFDALVGEPNALTARVDALKAEVDALAGKLGGDLKISQPDRTYVEALIARRKLEGIWGGFADAGEFIDCLCRGLVCSIEGTPGLGQPRGRARDP